MKQSDINRLARAIEHVKIALAHLEKVEDNTELWQHYRTRQHSDSLRYEMNTMTMFLRAMQNDPNEQRTEY